MARTVHWQSQVSDATACGRIVCRSFTDFRFAALDFVSMSFLGVTVQRLANGYPVLPPIVDPGPRSDEYIKLPNGNRVRREYDKDGKLEMIQENELGKGVVFIWERQENFTTCFWNFGKRVLHWVAKSAMEYSTRGGQIHGLWRSWTGGLVEKPKKLYILHQLHGGNMWKGISVGKLEFQQRLPRAEQFVAVLSISVSRRLISFL